MACLLVCLVLDHYQGLDQATPPMTNAVWWWLQSVAEFDMAVPDDSALQDALLQRAAEKASPNS